MRGEGQGEGRRPRSDLEQMTPLPSFNLSGQVALVTGASSGIGRHLALLLAAAGAKVALAARRSDLLTEATREIEAEGGIAVPIVLDVTNPDSVAAAVAEAERALGPVNLLVNNAGVTIAKPVLEHTEADWDQVLDTNLKGAWLITREFAAHLVARGRPGRVVNIASILAERAIPQGPSYCAAKAGLVHLTHVLAMELARYGILVNALAPGFIETDLTRAFLRSEAGKRLQARIPLRRLGRPDDLDGAMLLLASPAGAYLTGAVITVDGGHSVAAI
jgi:NAD(P)-dependent dehydrogenase (short-subunit alcohol dehydrogenase family)